MGQSPLQQCLTSSDMAESVVVLFNVVGVDKFSQVKEKPGSVMRF